MNANREVVYRMRDHDAAKRWYEEQAAELTAWRGSLTEFLTAQGLDAAAVYITSFGALSAVRNPGTVPDGWRVKGKTESDKIVPDKRRKTGRDAAARLEELRKPQLREALPGKMPSLSFTRTGLMQPGVRCMAGTVWVTWDGFPDDATDLDMDVWEQARLSEYYTALEQDEAQERAS